MTRTLLLLVGLGMTLAGCPNSTGGDDDDDSATDDDDATADDDDAADDDDTTGDCWQANWLLDVASAPGPGANYPDPELSGECTGGNFVVDSNQVPHYTFIALTPNELAANPTTWSIPQNPTMNATSTPIPLLGFAGFTVGGTPWFGPNEAAVPDPYGDPVYNGIVDPCAGHTAMEYHNHALTQKCLSADSLVAEPWTLPDPDPTVPSPILGFAADGFPIYGPYGCTDADCETVVEFASGWVQIADPTEYAWYSYEYQASTANNVLDECNGRVGPDGTYRYHATSGFPYILGCFMGTPQGTNGQDAPGPAPDGTGDDDDAPTECEEPDDCEGECPEGAFGCTCAELMQGMGCVPTCTEDAHCEDLNTPQPLTCNEAQGLCRPANGP